MFVAPPVKSNDTVALIAASSAVPEEAIAHGVQQLEGIGLKVRVYPSCRAVHGYFAGDDPTRAQDIQNAFEDNNISAIFCARGGYGAQRLLPMIDWDRLKRHPKRFFGYSDVTALHLVLNQLCGLQTYHSPMPATQNRISSMEPYAKKTLLDAIFSEHCPAEIGNLSAEQPIKALQGGKGRGALIGGNLSLVASSLGTPYEIDTKDKILFLEDIGEEPYRIDRMLTQLRNAGKLAAATGILLGGFTDCDQADEDKSGLSLEQVIEEVVLPAGKPVIMGLHCGHVANSLTLPLGATLLMDSDACSLKIVE